ncbi:MAG TPA: CRISPR-associated endonuclease Cas2 [Spirochaetales bacterium]|nr:CRISPR-associated endonuclease Cas2 [Spirochaetales bacterium]HPD81385.1 CRISPR-associated endonuclease Cas2 [Spirochaetales bacterium]
MYAIVCYDIADPKRLSAIAKICESYGVRLQKSCFQVHMEIDKIKELLATIKNEITPKEDSIICYYVCEDCYRKIETIGINSILVKEDSIFL